MRSPEKSRVYDAGDCSISVRTLPGGEQLVKLRTGAVSMRIAVPSEHIAFLFGLLTQSGHAA